MSEVSIKSFTQSSLQDGDSSIYAKILNDIAKGVWVSGDRLVTTQLAKRYGTSINPVREALKQLQGEGFVTVLPNSGARVTKFEFKTMRDVFEILQLLEPYLASWFVEDHTEEQIFYLKELLTEMKALDPSDFIKYRELDSVFHSLICHHHYNKRAVALWQKNRLMLQAFHNNLPFSATRFSQSMLEHELIIECIEKRDVKGVLEVLEQHISNSGQYWSRHFQ